MKSIIFSIMFLISFSANAQNMLDESNVWTYCHLDSFYYDNVAEELLYVTFSKYYIKGERTVNGKIYKELWERNLKNTLHKLISHSEDEESWDQFPEGYICQYDKYMLSLREEDGKVYAISKEYDELLAGYTTCTLSAAELFTTEGDECIIYDFNDRDRKDVIPFVGSTRSLLFPSEKIDLCDSIQFIKCDLFLNLFYENGQQKYQDSTFHADPFFPEVIVPQHGTCGPYLNQGSMTWSLDADGTLTVSGNNTMFLSQWASDSPWYSYYLSIKKLIFADGVTGVGVGKYFNGYTNLTDVIIPKTMKGIRGLFGGCTGLTAFPIPENITDIANAFAGCTGLTTITIPESVTDISGACAGCTGLTAITIPESVTDISGAFAGCTGLTAITIPESVTDVAGAFQGCTGLESLVIPNHITSIRNTCRYCTNLKSIQLPDSLKTLGQFTFQGCTSLRSLIMPKGITSIGSKVMDGCHLSALTVQTMTPASAYESMMTEEDYGSCTLYIPEGSSEAYKAVSPWNKFKTVVEYDPTAIESITIDNSVSSSVFNLQGRKLSAPQKGINIIDGKKILVK